MITESRADFARRMGWNRSSVTRAVQDGRVVLEGDLVDVDASLAKINAMASPSAHHRAHAQQLAEDRYAKADATHEGTYPLPNSRVPVTISGESIEELNRRLKCAEANKREHEADMARMERETMAGNLIAREAVEFALDDFGATLRSLMENWPDRLAPVVQPLQSIEQTHAALAEAAQDVLQTMHEQLARRASERKA
jgi:phage terminase Nu1 subunit (DNA packaging protein)